MTLTELQRVVAPPLAPLERPTAEQWMAAEQTLGLALPADYKTLVSAYGAGMFNDFLIVFVPFSSNKYINLLEVQHAIMDGYRVMAAQHPRSAPFPAYPEPGGLFPWGRTDNGDELYWRTEGDPDRWPTVIIESRFGFYEEHEQTTTALVAGLLDGSIVSEVFPRLHDSEEDPFFEPRT